MKIVHLTESHFDSNDEAAHQLMKEVLDRPLFAHFATASEQGLRESSVWFLWEDGALWIIGSYETDSFPKRIEQEPRCAIGTHSATNSVISNRMRWGSCSVKDMP